MEWKLSEEQEAYGEALRGWLGDAAPLARVRTWLDAGDTAEFEQRYADDGMAGVGIPEELGGQGGSVVELALTAEALARAGVPSGSWLATVLAVPALQSRPDLVKAALAGSSPVALLVPAEQLPGMAPPVVLDGDGCLSGDAARVLGGDRADVLVAVAADRGGVSSLRLVDATSDGVGVRRRALLDRTRSVGDIALHRVPSLQLEADASEVLGLVTDLAAVLVAADALGAMQRMLDMAVEYAGQRHQFGVPIGSFQAVKHAAASILVDVEAGRSGVYYAAASVAGGHEDRSLHAAAVKAQVTAAAARAADSALTMHGAIGYTWEHDLQLFYKRARLDEHLYGAPASWNARVADGLRLT